MNCITELTTQPGTIVQYFFIPCSYPSITRTQPVLQNLLNPLDDALAFADIADSMSNTNDKEDTSMTQILESEDDGDKQGDTVNVTVEEHGCQNSQKTAWQNLFLST